MRFKQYRKKVFCDGCANFIILPRMGPLCVGTAEFVDGPLRKKIDVVGVASAEKRNIHNDCPLRTSVSLSAWECKKWLREKTKDALKEYRSSLKDYPTEEENSNRKKFLSKGGKNFLETGGFPEDYENGKEEGEDEGGEDVLPVGGAFDNIEPGSESEDGSGDLQDS